MNNDVILNDRIHTELKTSDFYYDLPEELIAQHPADPRDSARLMIVDRRDESFEHRIFRDITEYLNEGDVMVINDSKVIPARLYGVKEYTGVNMEVVLLRQREIDTWEVLIHPGRRAKPGTVIIFGDGVMRADVIDVVEGGNRIVKFTYEGNNIYDVLDKIGNMPLPPYITEKLEDKSQYQTVYANKEGSAAAPTAGLHFTPELLEKIKEKGVKIVPVMLHVGLGTFRPVKTEDINEHIMHTEFFSISKKSADIINSRSGRLIAVGTTSCRVIESAADEKGIVHEMSCDTGIFIYPGYHFKAVEGLITNFHLPESTLLMLVSALSSRELMLKAYNEAISQRYKFFSFGDAMFIR